MSITLKDIAREAAVSEGTASLALNQKPGVKQETRRRVLDIARQMGYVPSLNAKTLARKRGRLIGLLVPNIRNLFRSSVVQEIENSLRAQGYRMIFATTDSDGDYERKMIEQFISFRVECVILYPSIKTSLCPDYMELLRKNGIPLVFLNGYYDGVDAPCIMSDIPAACVMTVEHLIQNGYKHPVYVGACRNIVSSRLKIENLQAALEPHGLGFEPGDYIELEHTNYDNAFFAIDRRFKEGKPFDSVLTGDTYSAFGAYNAIRQSGLSVPGDVAVIHFDNLVHPDMCIIRMTCIEQDVFTLAEAVVNTVEKLVFKQEAASVFVPVKLVVRDSSVRG